MARMLRWLILTGVAAVGVGGASPIATADEGTATAHTWSVAGAGGQVDGQTTYTAGQYPWDRQFEYRGQLRAPADGCVSAWVTSQMTTVPVVTPVKVATACNGADVLVQDSGRAGFADTEVSVRMKVCAGSDQTSCGALVRVA